MRSSSVTMPGAEIDGYPWIHVPDLRRCIDLHLEIGRLTNPGIRCAGISVNTSRLGKPRAREISCASSKARFGVPCFDPVATGAARLAESL